MGTLRQRVVKGLRACGSWIEQARQFPPGFDWGADRQDRPRCTVVSAHFNIKSKHGGNYFDWFEQSMRIDCPLVFFAEPETIEVVRKIRRGLSTLYVESSLEACLAHQYADRFETHERHVPSKELAVIWHEKVNFINEAVKLDSFRTEFFAWMDAGHSAYRTTRHPERPWPSGRKLARLPVDKVMISTSSKRFDAARAGVGDYQHFIAGGAYLLHKQCVKPFHSAYYRVLEEALSRFPGRIFGSSDQCVLSRLCCEDPEMFHVLCHGYGGAIPHLY